MPPPLSLSALSPWSAHLCLRVEAFLRATACPPPKPRLVLGLSGGLDSSVLAYMLRLLSGRVRARVTAVHLDHGLRPESALDADHCAALCADLGFDFVLERQDIADQAKRLGAGLEETGRLARYALFETVREKTGAFAVLTAHHLDDQAEDVLMRLMRGAGWPALSGMRAFDPHRRLARPLLETPKAHLLRLARETGLAWREDASNTDRTFLRNRVRAEVLPLFLRENPDFLRAASEIRRQGETDRVYWDHVMDQAVPHWPSAGRPVLLPAKELSTWPQALRLRLYKRAVSSLGPGQALADTLHRLDLAWEAGQSGKVFQFPGSKQAKITREGVLFQRFTAP
ncbi:tRNA lysidine(34) synthetase TilS [Fundidesulfovibrio butyratiphilus]